jgi:hypothetical protein
MPFVPFIDPQMRFCKGIFNFDTKDICIVSNCKIYVIYEMRSDIFHVCECLTTKFGILNSIAYLDLYNKKLSKTINKFMNLYYNKVSKLNNLQFFIRMFLIIKKNREIYHPKRLGGIFTKNQLLSLFSKN